MATRKSSIEEMVNQTDAEATAAEASEATTPVVDEKRPSFKKYADARIPISKAAGGLWKSRHDTALARMKSGATHDAWDEAIKYYKNDQTGKRNRDNPDNPGYGSAKDITGGAFSQTENVVFANVSALVPSIYAKNPDVSIQSPKGDEDRDFTNCAQKLIRTLMQKRTAPGINLKPKMRRNVVMTTLTNISYIEVGYTRREAAVEGALAEIDAIAQKLSEAKDKKEIEELEGQLMALDEKVDLLQPAGPWCVVRHPKDVLIDPDALLPDGTDAKWIMVRDVLETSYLNAVFREKDEETGQWKSIYKPTHVLKAGSEKVPNMAGHDEEITNFSLLSGNEDDPKSFGYDDERTFKRAQRTYVWKIWDRTTRRLIMYADNDWSFPIWVWDDPYGLDDFFPLIPLSFHTDPEEMFARGEVSYYLDQQDEINRINSQVTKMRNRVSNGIVYNKRVIKDEATLQNLLNPVTGTSGAVGVDLPEGVKIGEALAAPPIPAVEFAQLFDKRNLFEAIDRVSGVSSVVKGVEYKTNTTNKAIDSYESSSAMRLDEKIDAIEEAVGRIGYSLLLMCLQFMSKEEVAKLIGAANAQAWPPQMSARDAQEKFTLTVTGGSSLKPTSKVRKEQAKEVGQIIGQFGANNPAAFLVVLKMFARAYSDELVLEPEDWKMIVGLTEQQLQSMMQPPAEAGAGGEGGQQQPGSVDGKAVIGRISKAIEKMPPELRQKFGKDIANGIPLEEIIGKLQSVMQQTGGNPQGEQPAKPK